MLTNYKAQCESKVKKWIEDTIDEQQFKHLGKDKFENLALQDYQEFIAECKVEVSHALKAEYDESKVTGSTDKQGEAVSSQEEYQKAIERHLTDELNNPKNLELLLNMIKQSEYAKYTQKSTLATTNTILYEHTCPTCKGDSEQQCTECRGQGEIRCRKCAGKGEYRCENCGGRGEEKCSKCYGKGICYRCNGRGRKKYIYSDGYYECGSCRGSGKCYKCNGKGTQWCRCKGGFQRCYKCGGAGFIKCPNCNGTTIAKCKTCNGTNKIIEIAQIQLSTTPKYTQSYADNVDERVKSIIENILQNSTTDMANIVRTELRQDESEKRVVENYQISVLFAKFSISFEDKQFTWLVYGKNLLVELKQDEILQAFRDYELQAQQKEKQRENEQKAKQTKGFVKIALIAFAVLFVISFVFNLISGDDETSTPKTKWRTNTKCK